MYSPKKKHLLILSPMLSSSVESKKSKKEKEKKKKKEKAKHQKSSVSNKPHSLRRRFQQQKWR
jgi:hypothetical protein